MYFKCVPARKFIYGSIEHMFVFNSLGWASAVS